MAGIRGVKTNTSHPNRLAGLREGRFVVLSDVGDHMWANPQEASQFRAITTTGNRFEYDEFLLGLRIGAGLELPISEDVFAPMEYSYTAYEDSSLVTGSGVEKFENSEGLFRAAVGWRF